MNKPDVILVLSNEQAKELESLLWECCTETDEGVKSLREDLPLSAIWRLIAEARTPPSVEVKNLVLATGHYVEVRDIETMNSMEVLTSQGDAKELREAARTRREIGLRSLRRAALLEAAANQL